MFAKDTSQENIECVFHEVIEWVNEAVVGGGRVLVHCHQGVSRSVTLCMAYTMFLCNIRYEELLTSLKKARAICNPNMGFTVQLMVW